MPHEKNLDPRSYNPLSSERYRRSYFPPDTGLRNRVSPERLEEVRAGAEQEREYRKWLLEQKRLEEIEAKIKASEAAGIPQFRAGRTPGMYSGRVAPQVSDPMWSRFDPSTDAAFDRGGLSAEDWAVAKKRVELDERRRAEAAREAARSFMGSDDPLNRVSPPTIGPFPPTKISQGATGPSGELLRPPAYEFEDLPPAGNLPLFSSNLGPDSGVPGGLLGGVPDGGANIGLLGKPESPPGYDEYIRKRDQTGMDAYLEALAGTKPPLGEDKGFLGLLAKNKELLGALTGLGLTFRGGPWAGGGVAKGMQDIRKGVVEDRAFKAAEKEKRRAEAARRVSIIQGDRQLTIAEKELKNATESHRHAMEMGTRQQEIIEEDRVKGRLGDYVFSLSSKGLEKPTLEDMRMKFPKLSGLTDIAIEGVMGREHFAGRQAAMTEANSQLAIIEKMANILATGDGDISNIPGIEDLLPEGSGKIIRRNAMKTRARLELQDFGTMVTIGDNIIKSVPKGAALVNMMGDSDYAHQVPKPYRKFFEGLINFSQPGLAQEEHPHFPENKVQGESESMFDDNLFKQIEKLNEILDGADPSIYGLASKEQAQKLRKSRLSELKDRTSQRDTSQFREILGIRQLVDPLMVFPDAANYQHFEDPTNKDWRPTEQHYKNYYAHVEYFLKSNNPRLWSRLFDPKFGGLEFPYAGSDWKEIEKKIVPFHRWYKALGGDTLFKVPELKKVSRNFPWQPPKLRGSEQNREIDALLPGHSGVISEEFVMGALDGLTPEEKVTQIEYVIAQRLDLSEEEKQMLRSAAAQ